MPLGLKSYAPRISLRCDFRRFTITTAANLAELREAQGLRHEVFCAEWQGKPRDDGLDYDEWDAISDHIMLREKATGLLIGTFRIIPVIPGLEPYSAHEFHLDDFLQLPGDKLEMGRACLRQNWRNNLSVIALYQGVWKYLETSRPRWLFGCSSVMTTDPVDAVRISRWIDRNEYGIDDRGIQPMAPHILDGFNEVKEAYSTTWRPDDEERVEFLLPPLLRTYLKAGAKLGRAPALDPEFGCVDYFTALDLTKLNRGFIGRFSA